MQTPAVQAVVPFALVHAAPQAAQFATVPSVVSQPLPALASQLPNPELQVMEQAPSEHAGVPFAALQALPHAPQWLTLVWVFVSQPLLPWPSQLPKLPLQVVSTQAPVVQDSFAFGRLHAWLQAPQSVSDVSAVSQPLLRSPSQLPKFWLHPMAQIPALQMGAPFVPLHAFPQAPQWVGFVAVLVSHPLLGVLSQS
jgi:hypothetical protein